MGRGAGLILAALCCASAPLPAGAQSQGSSPRLTVELRRDSAGGLLPPRVRAASVLADGVFDGALRNGFPVRLSFRLELHRHGTLFDRVERSVTWEAVVRLDPITNVYELVRTGGSVERIEDAPALERALSIPYDVDALPRSPAGGGRRFYYTALLEIESLSLSELEEIEAWLRGDLERTVRRGGDVPSALGRGARRLLIRFSGLPRKRFEARSQSFNY